MTARLRSEAGLTVVEAIVALLLLAVGSLAALQLLDTATRTTFRAEQSQALSNRLQAELEQISALPYPELALSSAPAGSTDENDPRYRISETSFAVEPGMTEPLIIDAAGGVSPAPEPFTAGDISGEIFKFVVWRDDPSCAESDCPGEEDLKRVIVAAKVTTAPISFDRPYQEVHADVVDPNTLPAENPGPGGGGGGGDDGGGGAIAQYWLTDTPCDRTAREPIEVIDPTDGHPVHNTRGRCTDGKKQGDTGASRGAPDLLFTEAPALDESRPAAAQPLYDYATDPPAEPQVNPGNDKGLLMPWSLQDTCLLEPALGLDNVRLAVDGRLDPLPEEPGDFDGLLSLAGAETDKQYRKHTWVSPPVTSTGVVLSGTGSLELWTQSLNGARHPGEVCVSVFIRQKIQVPVDDYHVDLEVDVPVVNVADAANPRTFFSYAQNPWPVKRTEISIPMEFKGIDSSGATVPLTLSPGSRIGLSVMVRKGGTEPGEALELMYDHPSFDSRLQLQTTGLLGSGLHGS